MSANRFFWGELTLLAPDELKQVRDEANRLLTQEADAGTGEDSSDKALPGRVIRPAPPEGHPGGSLERNDPFFEILERIENERHQRLPQAPIRFEY